MPHTKVKCDWAYKIQPCEYKLHFSSKRVSTFSKFWSVNTNRLQIMIEQSWKKLGKFYATIWLIFANLALYDADINDLYKVFSLLYNDTGIIMSLKIRKVQMIKYNTKRYIFYPWYLHWSQYQSILTQTLPFVIHYDHLLSLQLLYEQPIKSTQMCLHEWYHCWF